MSDWFDESGRGTPVDVAAIMDSGIPEQLWGIVSGGALVSVGTTSDGGALGITITLDGRWRREYGREAADFEQFLDGAARAVQLEASSAPQPASTARRSRKRGVRPA